MTFLIKLTYLDGKEVNVSLPKDEVPKFLEKLRNNEAYWSPEDDTAFYTPNNQVRFTSINKYMPPKEEAVKPVEEVKETDVKPIEEVKDEV